MSGRVALVTGSSRGIGRSVALRLAGEGYSVVINYRSNEELAHELLAEIRTAGGCGMCIGADVSRPAEAGRLVEETIAAFGGIDVLVNNAGVSKDQLLVRIRDQEWDDMLATNLSSVFYCCRAAVKTMIRKRYGRVINISSVVGLAGNPGQAHYAASKAGIVGLTRSIAKEYGARGINANVVAPGYIDTDMTASLGDNAGERLESAIALRRVGRPEDVAGVVSFLASNQAGYITGQVIRVDGGLSI